jgi:uncharacterized protein
MNSLNDRLSSRKPSLHESRGGRHLFVWGDVGQWLVVDDEVADLLARFERPQRVRDVLDELARTSNKPLTESLEEAVFAIEALRRRGLLGSPPPPPSPPNDPLLVSSLTLNITNRCNLRCPWCYNPRGGDREIAVSELIDWIAAGAESLDEKATFIILGGEPFLDQSRLLELVRGAKRFFPREILVSTNGTLVDEATPAALAREGVTVQVSLDAPTAERHDRARGKGVFDKAIATTKRLVEADVHTVFSMVMTHGCEDEFEDYFALAERLGVNEVRFIPLRRIGGGVDQAADSPDLVRCFGRLVEIVRRRPGWGDMLHRDFFSILMTACRFSRLRDNCGIGRRCLFVDADGTILPCPNHRTAEYRCGHVSTTPLDTILESSDVLGELRGRYRLDTMTACRQCAFRYWCAGDCRAEALSVSGSPAAPSPHCASLRKIMKEMLWLLADGWEGLGRRSEAMEPWS